MSIHIDLIPHGADMAVRLNGTQLGTIMRLPQRAAYTLSPSLRDLTGLSAGYAVRSPSELRPIIEDALERRANRRHAALAEMKAERERREWPFGKVA